MRCLGWCIAAQPCNLLVCCLSFTPASEDHRPAVHLQLHAAAARGGDRHHRGALHRGAGASHHGRQGQLLRGLRGENPAGRAGGARQRRRLPACRQAGLWRKPAGMEAPTVLFEPVPSLSCGVQAVVACFPRDVGFPEACFRVGVHVPMHPDRLLSAAPQHHRQTHSSTRSLGRCHTTCWWWRSAP